MRPLEKPLPIFKLNTGELRVQFMGGSPQGFARIAFMTEEGISVADTTFSAWSESSWKLLNQLVQQIEYDFEKLLSSEQHTQWSSKTEVEAPDISFKQSDWEFK